MPPATTSLSEVDYLKFNEMIHRIRALEHVATEHFLRGNSYYRRKLAEVIKAKTVQKRLPNPDASFFNSEEPEYINLRYEVEQGRTKIPVSALDSNAGHGCTFPYCPTPSGTCELCGLDEIQEQLLAAAEARERLL